MAGKLITEFNSSIKEDISGEIKEKDSITKYQKEIQEWKALIKRYGTSKGKITKKWRRSELGTVEASNSKSDISKIQDKAREQIKYLENRIKLINGDNDSYIQIIGYFGNHFVKKTQLMSVENPAVFILKREFKRADDYRKSAFFDIAPAGVQRGLNSQADRLLANIAYLEGKTDVLKYPVHFRAIPTSIQFE